MKMLVLGAGLQGSACAFDLLQNPAVQEVRLGVHQNPHETRHQDRSMTSVLAIWSSE